MSKHLNESTIVNELRQGSSFFQRPDESDSRVYPPQKEHLPRQDGRTDDTSERPSERTPVRRPQRRTVRHPFEIYEDQLDDLRRLKALLVLDGFPSVSMSEMVREALDHFIQIKKTS